MLFRCRTQFLILIQVLIESSLNVIQVFNLQVSLTFILISCKAVFVFVVINFSNKLF